jgi:hypothetical protein
MKFSKLLLVLPFLLTSCYKEEGLTTEQSASWIEGKRWKVEYFKTSTGIDTQTYKDYVIYFVAGWDTAIEVFPTIREGRWAVFKGNGGNILQLTYPTSYADVSKFNGNWVIVDQQMMSLLLKQDQSELYLTVIE